MLISFIFHKNINIISSRCIKNQFFLLIVLFLVDYIKKWAPSDGSCILVPETLACYILKLFDRNLFFYFELNLSLKLPMCDIQFFFALIYSIFFYCYLFNSIFISCLIDSIRLSLLKRPNSANLWLPASCSEYLLDNIFIFYCFNILLTLTDGLYDL